MTNNLVHVTTREFAIRIGVDPSTVRRWVEAGKLEPAVVTPGGHFRFDLEDALAQVSAKRVAA